MDQNIENNVETTEEKKEKVEFGEVKSMLNTLKEMCDTCRETIIENVKDFYNLNPDIVDVNGGILPYTKTDINAMSLGDIKHILTKYGSEENTEKILESNQKEDEDELETYRRVLHDIKDYQITLIENERTYAEGVEQAEEIGNQYQEYLSSDIYIEKRNKYIEELRKAAEAEPDEAKKRSMYKKISIFEDSLSLDFLTERLRDEKIGGKEVKSVIDGFFNVTKGNLVIEKYCSKITKFGYARDIYKRMFNLEEMFLPEKYHVYNNLFLYIYMRFVSYASPYSEKDKTFVKAITTNIVTLIYHKFTNASLEDQFKSMIMDVLDYFKDYREKFDKENTTHPNHPHTLGARKDMEIARKKAVMEKLDQLNITDYDKNADSKTLYKLLQDKIDEMKSEQAPVHNGETVEVTESEDGEVTIEPKMGESSESDAEISGHDATIVPTEAQEHAVEERVEKALETSAKLSDEGCIKSSDYMNSLKTEIKAVQDASEQEDSGSSDQSGLAPAT